MDKEVLEMLLANLIHESILSEGRPVKELVEEAGLSGDGEGGEAAVAVLLLALERTIDEL